MLNTGEGLLEERRPRRRAGDHGLSPEGEIFRRFVNGPTGALINLANAMPWRLFAQSLHFPASELTVFDRASSSG